MMCTLEDFRSLALTEQHRATLEGELDMWHKHYLPIGQTVLDVGAGCGETALFYLKHGAQRVICIEADRYESVPDYESWWDVPVAEVSTVDAVNAARRDYEKSKKKQHPYL